MDSIRWRSCDFVLLFCQDWEFVGVLDLVMVQNVGLRLTILVSGFRQLIPVGEAPISTPSSTAPYFTSAWISKVCSSIDGL
jgi:hypothetical protein